MFEYLNIALQIFLLISTLIFYFDKYKQRKLSESLDVLEKDLDKITVTEEVKETVEYIYYFFSLKQGMNSGGFFLIHLRYFWNLSWVFSRSMVL